MVIDRSGSMAETSGNGRTKLDLAKEAVYQASLGLTPRDQISLDGKSPPGGIPPGVAGVSSAKLKVLDAPDRAVAGDFNGERIVGRAWRAAENHVVFLELHY